MITDIHRTGCKCERYGFLSTYYRNSLQKFAGLSQENQTVDLASNKRLVLENYSGNDKRGAEENSQISKPLEQPVRYGASPAKAAQIERQSSSEGEESCTTEEDQLSVERSRPLMRSASPRRSASPMRRVQIGRSGSRRPTALAIKSLHYIPAREKLVCQRDEAESSSGEEGSEKTSKRSDNNVRRMSVQDAINLFERKQRDQTVDAQKTSGVSIGANKAVLRRWSAGMYESSKYPANAASENSASVSTDNLEGEETTNALETNLDSDPTPYSHPVEAAEIEVKPDVCEERVSGLEGQRDDTLPNQSEESRKLTASAEWSRQKEAELNQLLMKMMETKPARYRKAAPSDNQDESFRDQQRGGLYNHYKEKRDEKLKGETAKKRVGKETQVKAKPDMASGKVNTVSKRPVKRTQTLLNQSSESANSKSETPKPADVKKASTKASSLPAIRKSWPTAPSPRANVASPAKTPVTTTSSTAARRRSHPTPLVPQSTQKVERSQLPAKSVKTLPNDSKKSVRNSSERNQQAVAKASKPTKTKPQAARVSSDSSAKPKPNKVTKKSSVVPLEPKDTPKEPKEPKPFLRKGSRTGPGVGPVTKKKTSPPEQLLRDSVDLVEAEKNEKDPIISEPVNQQGDALLADSKIDLDLESETQIDSPQKCEDVESSNLVPPKNEDDFCEKQECVTKNEVEEEINISPTAWVEIEEHDNVKVPNNDGASHIDSTADVMPVRAASPRVRHSLSQMLLEESSEPDIMDWGNAENPPAMVYQKDAPKGFKRLLKFARKSKTDAN